MPSAFVNRFTAIVSFWDKIVSVWVNGRYIAFGGCIPHELREKK